MKRIFPPVIRCAPIFLAIALLLPGKLSAAVSPIETLNEIVKSDNAGNLEKIATLFTDDAILIPAGRKNATGKNAVREVYRNTFANSDLQLAMTAAEVMESGDFAIIRGNVTGTATPKNSGGPITVNDKFLMILKKESDGWKVHRWMFSSDK
jgi:uncharacterized protein (TIGR02246 family)